MAKETKFGRIAKEYAQLRQEKQDEIMKQARVKVLYPECDRAIVKEFREMKEKQNKRGVLFEFGLPKRREKKR